MSPAAPYKPDTGHPQRSRGNAVETWTSVDANQRADAVGRCPEGPHGRGHATVDAHRRARHERCGVADEERKDLGDLTCGSHATARAGRTHHLREPFWVVVE